MALSLRHLQWEGSLGPSTRDFQMESSCGVWVGGGGGQAGFLCFSPKWASSVTGSLPKDSQGN